MNRNSVLSLLVTTESGHFTFHNVLNRHGRQGHLEYFTRHEQPFHNTDIFDIDALQDRFYHSTTTIVLGDLNLHHRSWDGPERLKPRCAMGEKLADTMAANGLALLTPPGLCIYSRGAE